MSCIANNREISSCEESLMGRGISVRKSSECYARQPGPSICKVIPLTQGKVAIVNDSDFLQLSRHKWCALNDHNSGNFYAVRQVKQNGERQTIYMHREILGMGNYDGKQVDHKNHNGLDNRKENLRICTRNQNQHNMLPKQSTSSQFKGVSWHKAAKKWSAKLFVKHHSIWLGCFDSEVEAAKAYDIMAQKCFGEFACINGV